MTLSRAQRTQRIDRESKTKRKECKKLEQETKTLNWNGLNLGNASPADHLLGWNHEIKMLKTGNNFNFNFFLFIGSLTVNSSQLLESFHTSSRWSSTRNDDKLSREQSRKLNKQAEKLDKFLRGQKFHFFVEITVITASQWTDIPLSFKLERSLKLKTWIFSHETLKKLNSHCFKRLKWPGMSFHVLPFFLRSFYCFDGATAVDVRTKLN